MFHVGKLLFISALAIGLGVFLGTVPLADGLTAAEHSEALFDRDSAPRAQIHAAKRIESRQAARVTLTKSARAATARHSASRQNSAAAHNSHSATSKAIPASRTAPPPAAIAQPPAAPMAPITAGAANSPEQASASDKAALDRIISGRTNR